ncbi:MAG: PKD domain-containing protein [Chitinophagaceae bacterium]
MKSILGGTAALLVSLCFLAVSSANGQKPVANFTASPLAGCSPLRVDFKDMSSGSPTSWAWDFGNGNTSSLSNPSANYLNPGTYTVTLTVKNANGTNTLVRTQYVTVYESPTVSFSSLQTTGCVPLQVQFADSSKAGTGNTNASWYWDFGDGTNSTLQNPAHTYTNAGSFSVTLKVTNDKGCYRVVTVPNYITTNPGVTADFTNNLPVSCQPPATITFTNATTGPGTFTYFWDFGDGTTSTDVNPQHDYTTKGLYNVTLVATNSNGCTDTIVKNNLIPVGQFNPSFSNADSVCINSPVSFTNTSVPVPSSQTWDFGDGNTSSQTNPTNTFTAAGTYTVTLNTTYGTCTDVTSKTIVVVNKPTPDFTAASTAACKPPFNVSFQDQTPGAVSWQWKFGDGGTSNLQNPVHSYNNYGNYDVTLIVSNSTGCVDSITKSGFIKVTKPQVTIPSLPATGCIPYTINPVANVITADAVVSYLWDFGDGTTSNAQSPSHTYPTQGTYTVSLIVVTSSGCSDTLIIPSAVKVGSLPVADFSASPIPSCASQAVQFTDLSSVADAWQWNFGDGSTSSVKNPSHLYPATGPFTISLTVANNGCLATATKLNYVTIKAPISRFDITPDCSNRTSFTFTDQSIGPVTTWSWDFGDGSPTSSTPSLTHSFPALGVYTVKLTTTTVFGPGDQCSYTLAKTVHAVDENPVISASANPACKGSPIAFAGTVGNPSNIVNYSWDFGDGATSNTLSPTINHTYVTSGNYTVRLVTTDINGCTDIAPVYNLRVNGPVANFTATNATGCKGLNVTFNDLSTTDGLNPITSWQWDFGDGTTQNFTAGPFQHVYPDKGIYTVKLTISDASGCTDTISKPNLVIATDPEPSFFSNDTLTCPGATVNFTNTSEALISYSSAWDFGDGTTSLLFSPSHNYTSPGLYTVKLKITDYYGCPDSITKTTYINVDKPIARFNVNDSISSCTPFEVHFKDSSSYSNLLTWNFGDGGGPAFGPDVSHFYSIPGSYTAMLVATSPGGCTDTAYKTIAVYSTVGSAVNYTPLGGCSPKSVSFTATTSGPVTYFWDFGDGTTQNTTTATTTHVYTTFGDYVPNIIMTDPTGCLIPVSGVDTVHVTGSKTKFGVSANLICDSATINFIDSTTFNDPITNWNWSFGDGTTSTLQNPSHFYSTPGVYNVSLNTITSANCRDTLTLNNIIKLVNSPDIGIIGDSVVCISGTMTQQGVFKRTDTSNVTWSWSFPNGNTSDLQNPPTQTYNTAGNFVVTATATNSSGCKDTEQKNVVVNPLPVVDMPGTATIMSGTSLTIPATYSPNTINWQWSPQTDLSCSTCATPVATPRYSTTYHVAFTDSNGCRNSASIDIIVACKDGNIFVPNTFSPNGDGSNDKFYPRGKGIDRVQLLRVFNRWGEVVFEKDNFPVNDASYGWDGRYKGKNPQAGVYVYQVEVYCTNGELIKFTGNVALIL